MDKVEIDINTFINDYKKIFNVYNSASKFRNKLIRLSNNSLRQLYVCDLIPKLGMKYLLILESPHTDEINANPKIPLAGRSGNIVYKALRNEENDSMGNYVRNNICNCKYGIMNICNVPLKQTSELSSNINKTNYTEELVKALSRIREADGLEYTNKDTKDIHDCIFSLFKKKLTQVVKYYPQIKIVTCGKVAKKYFNHFNTSTYTVENEKKVTLSIKEDNIVYMPHPSHCDWDKLEEYYNSLNSIEI